MSQRYRLLNILVLTFAFAMTPAAFAVDDLSGDEMDEIFDDVNNGSGGGTSTENAFGHWKKHGAEFPEIQNASQYVSKTRSFIGSPPAGTLSKTRVNGDVVLYHPPSNTLVVHTADKTPRTMFKPDPSQHGHASNLDYFHAQ